MPVRGWLAAGFLAVVSWLLPACGIVLSPVALDDVRTGNSRTHLFGTITDEDGKALQDVHVRIAYFPVEWDWLTGTRVAERVIRVTVNGTIHEEFTSESSSIVRVYVSREGYEPLEFFVWHDEAELKAPHSDIWLTKDTTQLRVVLKKQTAAVSR